MALTKAEIEQLREWMERGRDWIMEFAASSEWTRLREEHDLAVALLDREEAAL